MKMTVMDGFIVSEAFFTLLIMALGGAFHGLLGLGFPMIATPLLSLMGTVQSAVLTTLIPTLSVNGASIISIQNPWPILRRFWPLGIMIVLGSSAGTHLLMAYESDIYKLILAIMILFYLNQKSLKISIGSILANFPLLTMLFFGLLSGLVSGLVNVMIPILIIYVLELGLKKVDSIVLMNFCFFSSKLTQVATFGWMGLFSLTLFGWALFYASVAVGSLMLGKRFSSKIDAKMFTLILRVSLWIMAAMLFVQYFS